jgi:nuclear GTP-binding protein
LLLRDWATGKLPRYSVPSKGPEVIDFAAAPANANEVHLEDVKTLESVQTRVEKRKASGLVRISAGEKDSREPEWERRWDAVGRRGAESDGDDDGDVEGDAMDDLDEEDEVGEDDDEDEDDEDEVASIITADNSEEEDEEEVLPPPAKRKRVPLEVAASAPASKRVAFGKAAPSAKSNPAVSLVAPAPKSVLKPVKSSRSSLRALKADKPKPKPTAPSAVDGKKPKVSVAEARKTQKKADPGVVASLSKTRSAKKIASQSATGKNDDGAYKFGEFF